MKNYIIISLLILLSSNTFAQMKQEKKDPKFHLLLEPEINYTFLENKTVNNPGLSFGLPIGGGVNFLFDLKLGDTRFHLLNGLRITLNRYVFNFEDIQSRRDNIFASIPAYLEYQINENIRFGLGTDLSFRFPYQSTTKFYDLEENLVRSIDENAFGTTLTPLILSYSRSFTSKNNRQMTLTLYCRKGLQNINSTTLTRYFSDNTTLSSSFDFKNSSAAIAFRFYFKRKRFGE